MNVQLPNGYASYFTSGGLVEGFIEGAPGYFVLWHPDNIAQNNTELEVEKYAPGFLGFGGDGGGECLVFDETGAVFILPLIGMEPDQANKVADSWEEFELRLRSTGT